MNVEQADKGLDSATDTLVELVRLFPYSVGVSVGLILMKVAGPDPFAGMSWWQVTAPVWGVYLFILAAFVLLLLTVVAVDIVARHLTARRERDKLETSA